MNLQEYNDSDQVMNIEAFIKAEASFVFVMLSEFVDQTKREFTRDKRDYDVLAESLGKSVCS